MTEPISEITSSPTPEQIQELALQKQELERQAAISAATRVQDTVNLSAVAQARVRADEAHVEQTNADAQATQRADDIRAEQAKVQAKQRADETRAEQVNADRESVIHEYQVLADQTAAVEAADRARNESNAATT